MKESMDFGQLRVKVLTEYLDLADAESLLSRFHPLGARKAMGNRLTYSVSYKGEWVALLLFDAPVKRNRLRESFIGWSDQQRESRLCHIANNSRFLICPKYAGTKNLASKVLSLVISSLPQDWMRRYGITILGVETYVDPQHNDNQGSCYKAAGWEDLGFSTGYQAFGEERTHSKLYFFKPLHKDSCKALSAEIPHALLTGAKEISGKSNNNYVLDAAKFNLKSLQKVLSSIKDPRGQQGMRYGFVALLSLCIAAVISGYTQYRQIADWIAKLPATDRVRFGLPGGRTPDETTISRFLRTINPGELQTVLSQWLLENYQKDTNFDIVTLDGKALRGTSSDAKEQKAFLNVFANELGITIEHQPTSKGGAEKATAQKMIKSDIDLEGKIVLADAIHTDRATINALKKKGPRMSSLLKAIREI